MTRSLELDLSPTYDPSLAELIEGTIGRDSLFHEHFGYYADGVGPETARLPRGWEARSHSFDIAGYETRIVVIAPDIHDLAISKLLAGREHDLEWFAEALTEGLVDVEILRRLLREAAATPEEMSLANDPLDRLAGGRL